MGQDGFYWVEFAGQDRDMLAYQGLLLLKVFV